MLIAEVVNLSGLRLTNSDTDGTFLHFDAGEKQVGIRLDNPELAGSSVVMIWAEKQLKAPKQPPAGGFTKLWREKLENAVALFKMGKNPDEWFQSIITGFREVLTRLDRSEASQKKLLTACEVAIPLITGERIAYDAMPPIGEVGKILEKKMRKCEEILEAAIKSKKEIRGERKRKL